MVEHRGQREADGWQREEGEWKRDESGGRRADGREWMA